METSTIDLIVYIVLGLACFILLVLGLREVNLWYWKINERLAEQKKTNELLSEIRDSLKK